MVLFDALIVVHVATGAPGLVAFWVPVLGKKGGERHRRWGRVFNRLMLATASSALAMSILSILWPVATHPHITNMSPEMIRAIFGWMMLYLSILTVNLVWYGWSFGKNKLNYARNREWRNLVLQLLVAITSLNCFVHGVLLGQLLMVGISFVGFATVGTNMYHLYAKERTPNAWQKEHLKGLVGAGISVYTAFFAFGSVRIMPELALNPVLWAIPLVTGLYLILYHRWRLRPRRPDSVAAAAS